MSDPGSLDAALKIAEIAGIAVAVVGGLGGGAALFYRLGGMTQRVEAAIAMQGNNIAVMQTDIRELNKLMTQVAVQSQRLDTHDHRLDMIERVQDDLRRGEGYVLPIERALGARKPKASE